MRKRIWTGILAGSCLLCMTGCGSEQTVQVRILDCLTETRLAAAAGITVSQALEEAEITIEEEDIVNPALDAVISEDRIDISVERHANVTVTENGKVQTFALTGAQVKDALVAADIRMGQYDRMNHDPEAYLTDGMEIEVEHQHLVHIVVDGEKQKCLTKAKTVKELLREQGIRLDAEDKITPKPGRKLSDGLSIAIERMNVQTVSEYVTIPYETRTEYSDKMYEDETKRKQRGEDGKKEIIYEVTYVEGQEESRRVVEEKVIKEPVDNIIVKGTAARPKRRVVSREQIYDCDGSGHGYYIITWSDGTVEYEDF